MVESSHSAQPGSFEPRPLVSLGGSPRWQAKNGATFATKEEALFASGLAKPTTLTIEHEGPSFKAVLGCFGDVALWLAGLVWFIVMAATVLYFAAGPLVAFVANLTSGTIVIASLLLVIAILLALILTVLDRG